MGMIKFRIRELSKLPPRFNTMLEQSLLSVRKSQQDKLCVVACLVSNASWKRWHEQRQPEDNRQEHEWVVFANVMKIAEAECLSLSEKRVATAFAFTHDSYFIPRIMEQRIRDATTPEKKEALEKEKEEKRLRHMKGGAKNANSILRKLKNPNKAGQLLFNRGEIERCFKIVSKHDMWKLKKPCPPPSDDRLAVACLEADALWPLHPLGVLADLERPDQEGKTKDFKNPAAWYKQLAESLKTLVESRAKWKIRENDFEDAKTIFRTKEGHRLYLEWRELWNL